MNQVKVYVKVSRTSRQLVTEGKITKLKVGDVFQVESDLEHFSTTPIETVNEIKEDGAMYIRTYTGTEYYVHYF